MTKNSAQNFQLLKSGMENKDYLKTICKNEDSADEFLERLQLTPLSYDEIIQLINIVQNNYVKSLFVFHILRTSSYLSNLTNESILERLTDTNQHIPSRLNGLLQQLDIALLTKARIAQLQPEAAVSLLCFIPIFHKLEPEQSFALIKKFPNVELIEYWLNHFTQMPNAQHVLQHLIKYAEIHILDYFNKKMAAQNKRRIGLTMVKHLELFKPDSKMLQGEWEEEFLTLAVKLFLHGHNHANYKEYIELIANKLLAKSHPFSIQTIQQLIALQGRSEFQNLHKKTAYLTNYYLRQNAQKGEIQIFYDKGTANITSMSQPIQLQPVVPGVQTQAKPNETIMPTAPENTLMIENLAKREKTVRSFDYFLMHYKGQQGLIRMAIRDYLSYYAKDKASKLTHTTAFLLSRLEIHSMVKEEVFSNFLDFPELYDEQVVYYLFLFDCKRLLTHFGLQGGTKYYELVSSLCAMALKKLNPEQHKAQILIANKAKSEADFELSINKNTGFFSGIINHLKRCWHYGWTGFFKPNRPLYVIPTHEKITVNDDKPKTSDKTAEALPRTENNLQQQLTALTTPYSSNQLDALMDALKIFSLKENPVSELNLRVQVHRVFHLVFFEAKNNATLKAWLAANRNAFLTNRFKLIEILLAKELNSEQDLLFSELDEQSAILLQIKNELTCTVPQQKPVVENSIQKKANGIQKASLDEMEKTLEEASAYAANMVSSTFNTISTSAASFFANNPLSQYIIGPATEPQAIAKTN